MASQTQGSTPDAPPGTTAPTRTVPAPRTPPGQGTAPGTDGSGLSASPVTATQVVRARARATTSTADAARAGAVRPRTPTGGPGGPGPLDDLGSTDELDLTRDEPDDGLDAPPRRAPGAGPAHARPAAVPALTAGRGGAHRRRKALWPVVAVVAVVLVGQAGVTYYLRGRAQDTADRAVWARTAVLLPDEVQDVPRVRDDATARAEEAQAEQVRATTRGSMTVQVGTYSGTVGTDGDETVRTLNVMVARPGGPLDRSGRDTVRESYRQALAAVGGTLVDRDPGSLGGWMGCAGVGGTRTVCVAVDAAAVVVVTLNGTGTEVEDLAVAVREDVEVAL